MCPFTAAQQQDEGAGMTSLWLLRCCMCGQGVWCASSGVCVCVSGCPGRHVCGLWSRCVQLLPCVQDAIIRLDMSEYMERHSVSKLIGAPPGGAAAGGRADAAGTLLQAVPCMIWSLTQVAAAADAPGMLEGLPAVLHGASTCIMLPAACCCWCVSIMSQATSGTARAAS